MYPQCFGLDDAYNDPWYWHQPRRYQHPHFGLGISPAELQEILNLPAHLQRQAFAERRHQGHVESSGSTPVVPIGSDGFQVCMDVAHFKPNEISVKTIDNEIIVEGRHEEREDQHGHISRKFSRRYTLPKHYNPNTVTSSLSSDGVLTIKAPIPKEETGSNERVIEIQQTGPALLHVKLSKLDDKPAENGHCDKGEQKPLYDFAQLT